MKNKRSLNRLKEDLKTKIFQINMMNYNNLQKNITETHPSTDQMNTTCTGGKNKIEKKFNNLFKINRIEFNMFNKTSFLICLILN